MPAPMTGSGPASFSDVARESPLPGLRSLVAHRMASHEELANWSTARNPPALDPGYAARVSTPTHPRNDRPSPPAPSDFAGRRVICFESRRASEMASLIQRYGGVPVTAPTLREVPIERNERALDFARRLAGAEFDLVILMTGVGTRALVAEAAPALEPSQGGGASDGDDGADAQGVSLLAAALSSVQIVARGPKPASALRELGLDPLHHRPRAEHPGGRSSRPSARSAT